MKYDLKEYMQMLIAMSESAKNLSLSYQDVHLKNQDIIMGLLNKIESILDEDK